jgi:MFS family permease
MADKYGRKNAALTYCVTYILICITKHWSDYWVLMLGRFFGGIATSLLFTAFESWLVAEHFKRGYEAEWLDKTFAKAIFLGNGLVSIVSGLLANYLVTDMSLGPVVPFDAAAVFLAVGGVVIFFTWSENKGDGSDNTSVAQGMQQAFEAIKNDKRVFYLGAMQSLFEASMYSFVFLWTPALGPNGEDIPHGMIFATMMVACMVGSSVASRIMSRPDMKVERYMQVVYLISACALAVPVFVKSFGFGEGVKGGPITFEGKIQMLAFLVFEAMVGVFWPSMMKMRSQYVPEEVRSTVMNFFRIPLNLFVCIILYNVALFPLSAMFGMCTLFLCLAAFLQKKLEMLAMERPHGKASSLAP